MIYKFIEILYHTVEIVSIAFLEGAGYTTELFHL